MGTKTNMEKELKIHRLVESKLVQLSAQNSYLGEIAADLGDLYGAFDTGKRLMEEFVRPNLDRQRAADILVDFRMELKHIESHIRSLRKPLEEFIDILYGDEATDGQPDQEPLGRGGGNVFGQSRPRS